MWSTAFWKGLVLSGSRLRCRWSHDDNGAGIIQLVDVVYVYRSELRFVARDAYSASQVSSVIISVSPRSQ
jgi:hypothetical protein